ncbi:MAG: CoA ester lyase [Roseovarius sp.]|nr:CoA ester lyase [Roseovarius sp.]
MMRSLLFVPGDSSRKFAKAMQTDADALVLDLEDSVALSAKPAARETVCDMLKGDRAGKQLIVRVNAYDTGFTLTDLAKVMPSRPDAIMLPKCRGGADVALLGDYLCAFETAFGIPVGDTGIISVATETAESIQGLPSYTPAHPRLRGLLWGAEDLMSSLGATSNRDGTAAYSGPFQMARNQCLVAAASAGVVAIDTVCTNIKDLAYVAKESSAARRDGFGAKAVIHPDHIAPVNTAFTPTAEEIAWARAVIAAFEDNPGMGVVAIDGMMIDKPHERAARKIIALVD